MEKMKLPCLSSLCIGNALLKMFFSRLLFLVLCVVGGAIACDVRSGAAEESGRLIAVEIGYDLLFSLGEYHELSREEEKSGADINAKIIPVVEGVISGFEHERERYCSLAVSSGQQPEQGRIDRINSHIDTFSTELTIRKKAVELEHLLQKQEKLLMEK